MRRANRVKIGTYIKPLKSKKKFLKGLIFLLSLIYSASSHALAVYIQDEFTDLLYFPEGGDVYLETGMDYQVLRQSVSQNNITTDGEQSSIVQNNEMKFGLNDWILLGVSIDQVISSTTSYTSTSNATIEDNEEGGMKDPYIMIKARMMGHKGYAPKGDVVLKFSPEVANSDYDSSTTNATKDGVGRGGNQGIIGLDLGNKQDHFELKFGLFIYYNFKTTKNDINSNNTTDIQTVTESHRDYSAEIIGQYSFPKSSSLISLGAKVYVFQQKVVSTYSNGVESVRTNQDNYLQFEVPLDWTIQLSDDFFAIQLGASYYKFTESNFTTDSGSVITTVPAGDGYALTSALKFSF